MESAPRGIVLAVAAFLTNARATQLPMLYAYFDESGTHGDAPVLAVGGLVASAEDWFGFEMDWCAALDAEGVDVFHMTEFENYQGAFAGWSKGRHNSFAARLIEILKRYRSYGVARAVDRKVYQEVLRTNPLITAGTFFHGLKPELFALRNCLYWLCCHWDGLPSGERMAVVFDWRDDIQGQAREYVRQVIMPLPWASPILAFDFGRKEQVLPLQGADFVAHEAYKHMYNQVGPKKRDERKSMSAFVEDGRRFSMRWCGKYQLAIAVEQAHRAHWTR